MKNHLIKLLLAFAILCFTASAYAQSIKYITLKDGSTLKGRLLELKDGVYTIQTAELGQIQIRESRVHRISSTATQSTEASSKAGTHMGSKSSGMMGNAYLMNQAQQMQGQIMNNPQIMSEIQGLMDNEDLMKILTDQQFLNELMTGDPSQLENNPKIKKLMNDPEMKRLMESIGSQMSP